MEVNVNKALEMVKVDPDTMIVECNRILDSIDLKRESLMDEEVEKVIKIFKMNRIDAEIFAQKINPVGSIVHSYGNDQRALAKMYLEKCISVLDKGDSYKIAILRKDYTSLTNFV